MKQYSYDSYGQFIARVETVAQLYGYTAREQDADGETNLNGGPLSGKQTKSLRGRSIPIRMDGGRNTCLEYFAQFQETQTGL